MGDMQLWDDNPTVVDLLGFTPIVDTVVAALNAPALNPVTIGVQSPWGGGKSTVLRLLEQQLEQQPGTTVVRLDPWEFDDQFDVRGTVIAEILQHLLSTYGKDHEGLDAEVTKLLERIGSSRVAAGLSQGRLVAQSKDLIEALTPKSRKDAKSLAGFRDAFAGLVGGITELERLVVLVDDLDRCLPDAVMATLEAIKLFLSVKKVAFVLAADQEMVRESIAASLDATGRGEQFATRYLEKIVQVPLSLPRVGTDQAATFIALLLSAGRCPDVTHYQALVQHAQQRRAAGMSQVLADLDALPWAPDSHTIGLASRLASGLAAHRAGSPRSIKRFLNAFSLRTKIAEGQGITLEPAVIAKLMLLEDSHAKDFEVLAGLPDAGRAELLEHWQAWGRGEREDKPDGISEASERWAASEPDLAGAPIGPYLTLAASLMSLEAAATLTQEQLTWVMALAGEDDTERRDKQALIVTRPVAEQWAVAEGLLRRARREPKVDQLVESLVHLAQNTPELSTDIAGGLWALRDVLTPGSIYDLGQGGVAELTALVARLADASDIDPMVTAAAAVERDRG